jgi:hypothetical protein
MKKLIPFLLIILATGCVTQRRCNDKFPAEQSTNIRDSIRYSDITVYDTVTFTKWVEIKKYVSRDSVVVRYVDGKAVTDKLILKGRYSEAVIWMQNNVLKGELTESGWIPIQTSLIMANRTIKEYRDKSKTEVKIVTEYRTKKFVKILAWAGGICISLLLLYVALVLVVKFTKININPFGL